MDGLTERQGEIYMTLYSGGTKINYLLDIYQSFHKQVLLSYFI
jgi:hypothetical protein